MKKKVLTTLLATLLLGAVVATLYMAVTTKKMIDEYNQLEQDYQDLQVDHLEIKLQHDSLIDQIWMDNQNQMMEE